MVLDAAAQAPSAGCQQLYTILDITDPALKERLAETCDHQSFIARAPVVLIFCADCLKWFDAYVEAGCTPRQPRAGDLLLHIVHENRYRRMDGAELRAMFAHRTQEQGFDAWMDAFCRRKYDSDFAREMSRSVEEYLRDFEEEES